MAATIEDWEKNGEWINPEYFNPESDLFWSKIKLKDIETKMGHLGIIPTGKRSAKLYSVLLRQHLIDDPRNIIVDEEIIPVVHPTAGGAELVEEEMTPPGSFSSSKRFCAEEGFSLSAAAGRSIQRDQLSKLITNTALYYDEHQEALTMQGAFLKANLQVTNKIDESSLLVILREATVEYFGADSLAEQIFLYYKVEKINGNNLHLVLTQYNLPTRKRPSDMECAETAVVVCMPKVLCALGDLREDILRSSISRPSTQTIDLTTTGMKRIHDVMNGKDIAYLDKNKLSERILESGMARRLMQPSVYEEFSTTAVDFKPILAFEKLEQQGNEWMNRHHRGRHTISSNHRLFGSEHHSRHYVQLHTLKCVQDGQFYKSFFTVGSPLLPGSRYEFGISLQSFIDGNLKDSTISEKTMKKQYCIAVENLEYFLRFTCGDIYEGVTTRLRHSLTYGVLGEHTWECVYVQYTIESAISEILHHIRLTRSDHFCQYAEEYKNMDISNAIGVKSYMQYILDGIIPTESAQSTFLRDRALSRQPQASGLVPSNKSVAKISTSKSIKNEPCKKDFLHYLGVKNKFGDIVTECKRTDCNFAHDIITSNSTKATFNSVLKQFTSRKPYPVIPAGDLLNIVRGAINKRK
jgi:hypothetical protein